MQSVRLAVNGASMSANVIVKVKVNGNKVTFTRTNGYDLKARTYVRRSESAYSMLGYALGGAYVVESKQNARGGTWDVLPRKRRRVIAK